MTKASEPLLMIYASAISVAFSVNGVFVKVDK